MHGNSPNSFAPLRRRAAARLLAGATRDEGQDLAEYGLLLGAIAVVVIGAVTILGGQLEAFYQFIVTALPF